MLATIPRDEARARLRAAGYELAGELNIVVEVWLRSDGFEVHLTPERDGGGVWAYLEQMILGAELG